jgi:K(+)-stimulated pyrophosphate-energized sodium pump
MLYRISLGITAMIASISTFAQDNTEAVAGTAVNLVAASEKLTTDTDTVPMDQILTLTFLIPVAGLLALLSAFIFFKKMMKADPGTEIMREIAQHVRDGAKAYLRSQTRVVAIVVVVVVALFVLMVALGLQSPLVPVAFLFGAIFSGLCGWLGMQTATLASSRTAQGCCQSLNAGLQVAFRSGAVMGLVVVGFGLLNIVAMYWALSTFVFTPEHVEAGQGGLIGFLLPDGFSMVNQWQEITAIMLTYGIGASLQALFARVGGGIFTKAADVGADLVGKVEAGIPEDDPRNPATIADNVGDNVGDVAGMGADLYESYCGSILATAALGAALPATMNFSGQSAVVAPMAIAAIGIIISIIGVMVVRCKDDSSMKTLLHALDTGTWGATGLIIIAAGVLAGIGWIPWGIFGAITTGLVAGSAIGWTTGYFTSDSYAPTQGIAKQAEAGPATTIIDGMAVGMYSAWPPVVIIVIAILTAFGCNGGFDTETLGTDAIASGLYGIGFAAVGMLSTLGITLATDAYGPIADNAGGNAEMAGLPAEVRERTDALDMLGNTTAAIGKGFAIGSAALTALALLAAYIMGLDFWVKKEGLIEADTVTNLDFYVQYYSLNLMNPLLICGLFLGGMLAFVFCAMTMKAVGRAAGAMVDEVRRQFKEHPGIMTGTEKPDYARCVAISTRAAQKEMIVPSLLAIIAPVAIGLVLGVAGVMGVLAGALATGFSFACMLNNAGGAWDNAKKYVEKGNLGGKNSDVHKACVVGDTVGDPFKDTSGPSLNILIKLMSMVCVVFSPVIVRYSPKVMGLLGLA